MSLDVYLEADAPQPVTHGSGIFIRENGENMEISRDEWDQRFPGREPVTVNRDDAETYEVYSRNITHNLTTMAEAARLYEPLWRPDEIGITHAKQLIEPLATGYNRLISEPELFKQHNPPNGWGTYETLVDFVADYLSACIKNPAARVRVWR